MSCQDRVSRDPSSVSRRLVICPNLVSSTAVVQLGHSQSFQLRQADAPVHSTIPLALIVHPSAIESSLNRQSLDLPFPKRHPATHPHTPALRRRRVFRLPDDTIQLPTPLFLRQEEIIITLTRMPMPAWPGYTASRGRPRRFHVRIVVSCNHTEPAPLSIACQTSFRRALLLHVCKGKTGWPPNRHASEPR